MRTLKQVAVFAGVAALALGAFGTAGCGKKFSCKALQAKVRKCKKEIEEASVAKMVALTEKEASTLPEAIRKQRIEGAKKGGKLMAKMVLDMVDAEDFVKRCKKAKDNDDKYVEHLRKCFKKSSCKAFAECVVKK